MAVAATVKFISPPISHLICPICQEVFRDPVINTRCGHTLCRPCILDRVGSDGAPTQCPLDGEVCEIPSLVVNRALVGQIDDLEVFCSHGLLWSEEKQEHTPDPTGCPEKVKYGQRIRHEAECDYRQVPCPHGGERCGYYRRRELDYHLPTCRFIPCPHCNKGCEFVGNQGELSRHKDTCGYRGLTGTIAGASVMNNNKVGELMTINLNLQKTVESLTGRVTELEQSRDLLTTQLQTTVSSLQLLQQRYEELNEKMERRVKRTASDTRKSGTAGSHIYRSASSSSLPGNTSPRVESWTMPFTFKCIGTLRGHQGVVWCLKTRGKTLFSAGGDKVIKVWDLDLLSKGCTKTLQGHTDVVQSLAVGDNVLFSAGTDQSIRVWNLEDFSENTVVENAHDNVVAAMVCTSDFLFSSSFSVVKVWDIPTMKHRHTIQGLHHWVRALALNYGEDKLYSGSHNTIEIWDTTGKFNLRGKIDHKYGSVHSLAITSQYIIAGTSDQNLQVFLVATQEHIKSLSSHSAPVTDLTVSPSGRFLFASLGSSSCVRVWNLENMLPIQSLLRHEGSVNTLVLYGDFLLSGAEDHEIKVYRHFRMM